MAERNSITHPQLRVRKGGNTWHIERWNGWRQEWMRVAAGYATADKAVREAAHWFEVPAAAVHVEGKAEGETP